MRSNRGRIGNALPLMVEGSKARSKRNKTRAQRHARMGIRRGLEGALEWRMKGGGKIQIYFRWPNFHGRPAQVEKFSKVKIFQKQFQCSPFHVGLPLDGFR